MWTNIVFCKYANDDPNFPGLPYVEFRGNRAEKSKQLSLQNDTFDPYGADGIRVTHNPNDELSLYAMLQTLRQLCHPDQKPVFCHAAKKNLLKQFQCCNMVYRFDAGRRIGTHTIGKLMQHLHERCALSDLSKNRNHDWRTWAISKMASKGDVNNREVMCFARHSNPCSQLPYVKKTSASNAQFQAAIQSRPMPSKRDMRRPKVLAQNQKKIAANSQKTPPPKTPKITGGTTSVKKSILTKSKAAVKKLVQTRRSTRNTKKPTNLSP